MNPLEVTLILELIYYAAKADLNNATGINTFKLAAKSDLAGLKAEIDKLDIDKLVPVAVDLSKLNDVVKNDVVKKAVYAKLVAKVNGIDTIRLVLKTKYDIDKSDLKKKISDVDKKIPDTSRLVKKTDYNAIITEIEGKIPNSGLATSSALTAVENKMPNVSNLVKKTDCDTKINEIEKKVTNHNHDKYNTTPELNKLTAENFAARLAQANLITKIDLDNELRNLNRKINSNKMNYVVVENELKTLQTFDSSYFRGKSRFEEDGAQNYLVFQSMYRYFKKISGVGNGEYIYFWKSKGLSYERISSITTSNYSITPELRYYGSKIRVKFNGSCLKQDKITYTHGRTVNIHIVYEIDKNYNISSYPTLENCLFGAVSLTKNNDIDKYKYSGYGIGFDKKGKFSVGHGLGRNCIIFGVDMGSSIHVDNKKDILVLGEGPTQGLDGATLTAEKKYLILLNIIKNFV